MSDPKRGKLLDAMNDRQLFQLDKDNLLYGYHVVAGEKTSFFTKEQYSEALTCLQTGNNPLVAGLSQSAGSSTPSRKSRKQDRKKPAKTSGNKRQAPVTYGGTEASA